MSISKISLFNFKSYKCQDLVDLSPRINLILGRNGHGKSNLFNAISFIFSDFLKNSEKYSRVIFISFIIKYHCKTLSTKMQIIMNPFQSR